VRKSQRLAKSYTALQAIRHRFFFLTKDEHKVNTNIYAGSCFALEYNKRFGFGVFNK